MLVCLSPHGHAGARTHPCMTPEEAKKLDKKASNPDPKHSTIMKISHQLEQKLRNTDGMYGFRLL